jgi:Ca-activated chloride channel family protein
MKYVNYTKFVENDFGISAEELLGALSDYLLGSGFDGPRFEDFERGRNSIEELREAIRRALENGELFRKENIQQMMERLDGMPKEDIERVIDRLVEKLAGEGYISPDEPGAAGGQWRASERPGDVASGSGKTEVRFEITGRSLDFLGYKTLKDLMGSLGKAAAGRHDTREMATGIEASGSSKNYEFGDTLNLDVHATLARAIQRQGLGGTLGGPLGLEYSDLMVHQSEHQSSCATVLMLDCSHSMILYGEDRFTPAKRVALGLSHLIRTQYPGDSLHLVVFHDTAEELPVSRLARVQVGPYHTNTRAGLALAQRILRRQRKEMQQIIMITDGKPSAVTLEDGRIYKNPFGLDPLVMDLTFKEVHQCKRRGILINTFMLARDYALVDFVRKITAICRGKAYFTSPYNLGQYLLMDYMNMKSRIVH